MRYKERFTEFKKGYIFKLNKRKTKVLVCLTPYSLNIQTIFISDKNKSDMVILIKIHRAVALKIFICGAEVARIDLIASLQAQW